MEIQFSIPLKQSRPHANTAQPPAPTGRSAGAAAARGGTHRFALDSRTRHTRRSSTRARTGCSTCKKRHVKCDETKPACSNCMKWRGYCDGYAETASRSATPTSGRSTPSVTSSSAANAKLIHTNKAPFIVQEPDINSIRFSSDEQRMYFEEWTALSINFLSGSMAPSRLWTDTMPQVSLEEPTLRYAAMAVGAMRKASMAENGAVLLDPANDSKHYLNAVVYYCEALRVQARAKPCMGGLRTAMLAALLFICFESMRGNMPAALKHVTHGFSMLNELAACSEKAPELVSLAPAPPALVQQILDCYRPLELQSRSFMGSYKKVFLPPNKDAEHTQTLPYIHAVQASPPAAVQSPPSRPGSPWPGCISSISSSSGFASPNSQGSPHQSHSISPMPSHISPPGTPPGMPGIAPFTQSSPYYRPRSTNITQLEELPDAFISLVEASGFWTLVQRQMVQYIPILNMITYQLALPKAKSDDELEARMSSVKKHPKIIKFVEESQYWLQRWIDAFEPLLQVARDFREMDYEYFLRCLNLRIEYLVLVIYTAMPRFSTLEQVQRLTPQFHEITAIAETLITSRQNCGFAMDSGWTWPLFVAAISCRDPLVQDNAMRILGQYPIRNALRDSRVFRAIALKNRECEDLVEDSDEDEPTKWLLLRRREIVFEDLGSNVVFRFAQKDPMTGQWELVEEVAAFSVGLDERLEWRRRAVSESASILSGYPRVGVTEATSRMSDYSDDKAQLLADISASQSLWNMGDLQLLPGVSESLSSQDDRLGLSTWKSGTAKIMEEMRDNSQMGMFSMTC